MTQGVEAELVISEIDNAMAPAKDCCWILRLCCQIFPAVCDGQDQVFAVLTLLPGLILIEFVQIVCLALQAKDRMQDGHHNLSKGHGYLECARLRGRDAERI